MKKTKTPQKQVSELELLEAIDNISKRLSYKFKFGYHEIDDMRQQISVFAIEGLEKYDYERPLENFLWTHVRNRLFNFKRDNYQRPDKPCLSCEFYNKYCADTDKDCNKFNQKKDCELYLGWYDRNNMKKNLMYLNTIEDIKEFINKKNHHSEEYKELIKILDEHLCGELRVVYLKIKYGSKVYKQERNKLILRIKEILDEQ